MRRRRRGGAHLAAEAETEDLLLHIGHSILCNSPGGRMGEVAATKCWRCHPSQVTRPSAQLSSVVIMAPDRNYVDM